jgi:hypothetical protein
LPFRKEHTLTQSYSHTGSEQVRLYNLLYWLYIPERERRPEIPRWAERERTEDLAWIGENLQEFWNVARSGFESEGRGALVIDVVAMATGKGHQFGYVKQEQIRQSGSKDEIRMVAAYDPSWELVIILLKQRDRMSSYRVGIPGQQSEAKAR